MPTPTPMSASDFFGADMPVTTPQVSKSIPANEFFGSPSIPEPIKPSVPGGETASFKSTSLTDKINNNLYGDTFSSKILGAAKDKGMDVLKLLPNAATDVKDIVKEGTYGTAKKILYDIPTETAALIKESGGVENAAINFISSFPEAAGKLAWGLIPQSLKEIGNTDALSKIPSEFQNLVQESGGYAAAFKNLAESFPEALKGLPAGYAEQLDRAEQAAVNHPVIEALGYYGLKQLAENPELVLAQSKKAVETTGEFAKSPIKSTIEAGQDAGKIATDLYGKAIKNPLQKKFVADEKLAWEKPSTRVSGFKKATEIYDEAKSNGNDIADTLVKNKIRLDNNMQDGRYSTTETAESIRADAGKAAKELLRPALEAAEPGVEAVPSEDVIAQAKLRIREDRMLPQEDKNLLSKNLDATAEALSQQYPNGLKLTDILDEKILRDYNSKYNPLGDIASNNKAKINKAVADSLRKILKEKSPPEVHVDEFQGEMSKQYEAANYLDELNGKKVPQTILSKIAKTAAKVVGASVGAGAGGGVLGGVGGYHIGGMVESLIENMPNPVKGRFLNELEKTNPPAYDAMVEYIGKEEAAKLQRRLLAPPVEPEIKKEGGKTNISSGPTITLDQFKGREPAVKPGINPKTGLPRENYGNLYEWNKRIEQMQKAAGIFKPKK